MRKTKNRRSIDELEVTKGKVSVTPQKASMADFNVASRNGDLYVNSPLIQLRSTRSAI